MNKKLVFQVVNPNRPNVLILETTDYHEAQKYVLDDMSYPILSIRKVYVNNTDNLGGEDVKK